VQVLSFSKITSPRPVLYKPNYELKLAIMKTYGHEKA
jgi:hypothetical protein